MPEFNSILEIPRQSSAQRRRKQSGRSPGTLRILTHLFFRRFFDNDTIQPDGDTVTTVARAVAFTAVPGLVVAFFLQNLYYGGRRAPWGAVEDQYLFVLFSFLTLGAVALFEWDMLFPDRLDFLVLSPLPIRPRSLFLGKICALAAFLGIFLLSANFFGALLLPAITHGQFFRQLYAHVLAAAAAGIFAALFFLALGGILLCVFGGNLFRTVSPFVQLLSVTALALFLVHYVKSGDTLHLTLAGTCTYPAAPILPSLLPDPPSIQGGRYIAHYKLMEPAVSCSSPDLGYLAWLPPVWFLGLYQHLLYGVRAPAFAAPMAVRALKALALNAFLTLTTYPLAWARMRRLALEGVSRPRRRSPAWLNAILHRILRRPGERAVFHFITQTLARNNRYQVYLAVYSGTGLAFAMAFAITVQPRFGLSQTGLHAVLPLLLFWVIAGLRSAFAFPLSLAAGWIFRITGVSTRDCATAGRRWSLACAFTVLAVVLALLTAAHWSPRQLLVQAVTGAALTINLADAFFLLQESVPFNQPRRPGRTNLPLILTLYIGVFPPLLFGVIALEHRLEQNLTRLLVLILAATAVHFLLRLRDRLPEEIQEEYEGYEDEFQILGLS